MSEIGHPHSPREADNTRYHENSDRASRGSEGYHGGADPQNRGSDGYHGDTEQRSGDNPRYPVSDRDIASVERLDSTAEALGIDLDDELRILLRDESDLDLIGNALNQRLLDRAAAAGIVDARHVAAEPGSAGRKTRQVGVRLDPGAYMILERIAIGAGVAPTTMARVLLRKALADAVNDSADQPLP